MLGIEAIRITPDLLFRTCAVDEFKGLWTGLEKHTTGLQLLSEVAKYGENFKRVLGPLQEQPLTPEIIAILHATQMQEKSPSAFKSTSEQLVFTQDDKPVGFLDTAEPAQVGPLLTKLCEWLNKTLERRDLHPLIVIAVFTAVFLQISPFEKGNMRMARFLITLLLLKSGYSYAPYVTLDKVMEEKAGQIFRALDHNQNSLEDGRPDWNEWLNCFLMLLQEQARIMEVRLYDKGKELSHLPTLSAKIMKLFEEHKRLQMKDIIRLTSGRRSTIKLRLGELVDGGYLKRHGQARSTWYSLV